LYAYEHNFIKTGPRVTTGQHAARQRCNGRASLSRYPITVSKLRRTRTVTLSLK